MVLQLAYFKVCVCVCGVNLGLFDYQTDALAMLLVLIPSNVTMVVLFLEQETLLTLIQPTHL